MLMEMAAIAQKYNRPFFAVTEGASITRNNGSAAVRNARDAQIAWEKAHGEDPDEDWGHTKKANKDELYNRILEAYKHIPIEINPNHTSSGTAYLRGTPRVVLRDKDPMVLAHELGHIDNDRKATQKLIDLMGWTANTTGWEWLMGKATVAKESLANRTALKILDKHKAPPEYREYARKAFDDYIDRIKRYDTYWTSDKPPTDR
jgi:hypothetical protein